MKKNLSDIISLFPHKEIFILESRNDYKKLKKDKNWFKDISDHLFLEEIKMEEKESRKMIERHATYLLKYFKNSSLFLPIGYEE